MVNIERMKREKKRWETVQSKAVVSVEFAAMYKNYNLLIRGLYRSALGLQWRLEKGTTSTPSPRNEDNTHLAQ